MTYLIQSIQTPQEFWSNNLGWVSLASADRFTGNLLDSPEEGHKSRLKTKDGAELALPLGGGWVPAAPAFPATLAFNEVEMTEILEIAYLALEPYTSIFDHIAETSDLDDEYLIALRAKIGSVMDSEVPPRELPTIVPGMRVRWNDPDDGACTHEGIVERCTVPIEDEIIVIFLEGGWCNECLRKEIEIL